MRATARFALVLLPLIAGQRGVCQKVFIPQATPDVVIDWLIIFLSSEGFAYIEGDAKGARFLRPYVGDRERHVGVELVVRFKQRADGLEVSARQDLVINARPTGRYRKQVWSRSERDKMQRLLEMLRADLAPVPSRADSGTVDGPKTR